MTQDRFRIDSHKLMYHPERVAQFLAAGDDWDKIRELFPIYVELSPVGACNHRCVFCAYDYIGYQPVLMDADLLCQRLEEMGRLGVKSVHLAGEGEPLLHKQIARIVKTAKAAGIDVGITTNGTVLNGAFVEEALDAVEWIKFSINAGSARVYDQIHRGKPGDFDKVLRHVRQAVVFRHRHGLRTTLGAQSLLLPENAHEMIELARLCRDELGLDYLVIKPYSQHLASDNTQYAGLDYQEYLGLQPELESFTTEHFQLIFRAHTMRKYGQAMVDRYTTCYSTPLYWAHVMTNGDLYGCPAFLQDDRFHYGNLFQQSFAEIWQGERRRQGYAFVRHHLDISECRRNCRMDEVNHYLADLKEQRIPHVNFI